MKAFQTKSLNTNKLLNQQKNNSTNSELNDINC